MFEYELWAIIYYIIYIYDDDVYLPGFAVNEIWRGWINPIDIVLNNGSTAEVVADVNVDVDFISINDVHLLIELYV